MQGSIQEMTANLETLVSRAEKVRTADPLANDVYEAGAYWLQLGRSALENNTKVDYPNRAREEMKLLVELNAQLQLGQTTSVGVLLQSLISSGKALLTRVGEVQPLPGGHLGVLSTIKREFAFLESDFRMTKTVMNQLGIRYSSAAVWVSLQWALAPEFTCAFGSLPRSEMEFELEDLLYHCADMPAEVRAQWNPLTSEKEVAQWFHFVALAWKHCGRGVLTNKTDIFPRLQIVQSQRSEAVARSYQDDPHEQ